MSRSGYSDDLDSTWDLIRWRGAVSAAIRGRRGQELLHGLRSALDAMPTKELIDGALMTDQGAVCALGALAVACGRSREEIQAVDPEDSEQVARFFGIADALAREVQHMNDEGFWVRTPEERWYRMRAWVESEIQREVSE